MATFPDLINLKESNGIFLKNSLQNVQLSKELQIQILSDLQYFVKFILPVMHTLTEGQIHSSIKMLLRLKYDSEYPGCESTIISSMSRVRLIRSIHGNSEMASYYFDEDETLYKIMLPQERFVPKRFWEAISDTSSMRQLLIKLGMKHAVSDNEIIDFAFQIESESKGTCELRDLKKKSSVLLKAAIKKAEKDKTNLTLIQSLADIKFIFPVKIREELCNLYSPVAVGRKTVALRGSLIENTPQHQDLIWTSMPIIALPFLISHEIKKMMEMAGVFTEPPMQSVTTNMKHICQLPCQSDDVKKTRAVVFRHSYAYLQTTAFPGNGLTGLPVVLVEDDTKLVKVEEVSLGLPHELDFRPYLYKIPGKDVMYAEFFKRIGVTEEPTVEQYCNALTAVFHDSCNKLTPNPNQMKTIKRAVEQIFDLVKKKKKESPVTFSEMLYLPSKDGRLYPSNTLYFNDTVFQASRLEGALEKKLSLLEKLSTCYLGNDMFEHHRLVQMLPNNLQPKMLSQCTKESLKSNIHICQHGIDCEFSGWFEKHLSSIAFRHGLICLIREQSEGEITHEDAADMCEQTFGSLKFICCRSLETQLCLDQQPLNDTDAEVDIYVKKGDQGCTFYLKHNDDMALKVMNEINMTLTKEINALLGNKLASNHLPVLGQLLMCDDLQEIRKALAKHGIHDSAEADNSALNPAEPGSVIPDEWIDCLDMNMLNNFEEGEHVGYLSNDNYIYAVIVKQLPGHTGQLSRRFKIQTGNQVFIEVSSLELYQFKREKKPKLKKMTIKSEASCMELLLHEGSEWNGTEEYSDEKPSPSRTLPASLEEAKIEIDKCLAEIWTLSEGEKHTAMKRLYLRWHPDKNPECIEISTEAFKYLMNRIDKLTNGKTTDSSKPQGSQNFRNFYGDWNQEARRHRHGRERFYRRYKSSGYNFWTHHENVPRPNRPEAQRWLRQAHCDLAAAEKDIGNGSTEWCLFKVHQAIEKALIAAEYKINGKRSANCAISLIAARVANFDPQLRKLTQIVNSVQLLGVDAKKTQYPNCHPAPYIPNEQFKETNEWPAVNMASEILGMIEAYVN
ncbi:hypothetical protein NHX12_031777 [Muraenolepis orangiensis]|uniref:HEPN domain-containing protein n=2 Tax=Muraenolepis orangiensis TaxID=630683 RepID=A0A9Q0E4K7_9TELE|nr:hypothetical protein NHX12_031777 [Muraenolepis orangiensis]